VGRCLPTSEETKDPHKNPGEAAVLATILVLGTYVLVSYAIQAFAGFGTTGIGLDNPQNARSPRDDCWCGALPRRVCWWKPCWIAALRVTWSKPRQRSSGWQRRQPTTGW
jgi:amino acid transporter